MSRRVESVFLVVSIGLAGLALWGLFGGEPAPAPAPVPVAAIPTQPQPEPQPAPATVEVTVPLPRLDDVPDSVSKLLGQEGNTSRVDRSDLTGELPSSIVKVLIDRGVVLRISEDPSTGVQP